MNEIFPVKDKLLYCSRQEFVTKNVHTVHNGIDTISFLGPKIWMLIPQEIKDVKTLHEFKCKI